MGHDGDPSHGWQSGERSFSEAMQHCINDGIRDEFFGQNPQDCENGECPDPNAIEECINNITGCRPVMHVKVVVKHGENTTSKSATGDPSPCTPVQE